MTLILEPVPDFEAPIPRIPEPVNEALSNYIGATVLNHEARNWTVQQRREDGRFIKTGGFLQVVCEYIEDGQIHSANIDIDENRRSLPEDIISQLGAEALEQSNMILAKYA